MGLVGYSYCRACFFATDDLDPAAMEAMSHWLRHNKEPVAQVKDYHRKTQDARLLWIRDDQDKKSLREVS